jgi:hypothetical protein
MKSSLATISVAIRILIRVLILNFFSQKSSSSKAGFLEALFGISVLGDPIVGRVLTCIRQWCGKTIGWDDAHTPDGSFCHP